MSNTFLDYASAKYYAGEPVITDKEFDKLAEYYGYQSVGTSVIGDSVPHAFPMWSLQKVYDDEEPIKLPGEVSETPKLDGAAVANVYIYGKLSRSLSRGDGKAGKLITHNMRYLIPETVPEFAEIPLVQITGEVVAPLSIENARNYAAGALQLQDENEFKTRDLTFVAYGMFPYKHDSWSDDMGLLEEVGLNTVLHFDASNYPQDGIVYRINSYKGFETLGYTAKHPRGAYALKERKGGVVTKLLDVVWQVGRSGVVSPVAILEPVLVGDATVSRATLHNMRYIEELELELGCLVEVERAGEIIPRIVSRVD